MGTPSSVVDTLTQRIDEYLRQNKNDFTGERQIVLKEITDQVPIRIMILVAVQMSHPGESPTHNLTPRAVDAWKPSRAVREHAQEISTAEHKAELCEEQELCNHCWIAV